MCRVHPSVQGRTYKLNIINLLKPDSLYNQGLQARARATSLVTGKSMRTADRTIFNHASPFVPAVRRSRFSSRRAHTRRRGLGGAGEGRRATGPTRTLPGPHPSRTHPYPPVPTPVRTVAPRSSDARPSANHRRGACLRCCRARRPAATTAIASGGPTASSTTPSRCPSGAPNSPPLSSPLRFLP